MGSDESRATGIDTTVPHSARIWNYWLGGKDNYEVDRQAGDEFVKLMPDILTAARRDACLPDARGELPGG